MFIQLLINILILGLAVSLAAYLLRGVTVRNFAIAVAIAVVLTITRRYLKPVVFTLFFPFSLNFLILSFFRIVINGLILLLLSGLLRGFRIKGFFWALVFGITISFVHSLFRFVFLHS